MEKNIIYKQTEEHRKNISLANKGKNKGKHLSLTTEFRKGCSPWNKNLTKETDERVMNTSKSLSGKNNPMFGKHQSKEWILKRASHHIGRKNTLETKLKMSKTRKEKIKNREIIVIMPKKDTLIEVKIQNFLKQLNIDFFTHQYIKEINHPYQCDILIPSMNLVIECDGIYWHKYPVGTELDHTRTKELIEKGFKVLRLWEHEIKSMKLEQFKEKLKW